MLCSFLLSCISFSAGVTGGAKAASYLQTASMFKIRYLPFVFILLIVNGSLFGQTSQFQRPSAISDVHIVYKYQKSNWDGTHASTIFLYVADSNRLESFKWAEGEKEATLVTAVVDWNTFSVAEFINHKLRSGQSPELVARLSTERGKTLQIEVGPMRDSLQIADLPWQSYDFDFAGLGFTWRALKDKKEPFYFHIADAGLVNGNVAFVNKGRVNVTYTGIEKAAGRQCYKYRVDGEGLENRGGDIWIDPVNFMIIQYKIDLPDEPGFSNGMLKLVSTYYVTPGEWEEFKKKSLEN